MDALTLFTSNNNKYFFDQKLNSTQWCHPILFYILERHQEGRNMNQWYNGLPDGAVHLEDCGIFSKSDIAYYFQKYLLLLKNGYFAKMDPKDVLAEGLSADQVRSALVNTRQITFEITDYCNLDCDYCTYGKFYNNFAPRKKNKMAVNSAKGFLDYMLELLNSPLNKSHEQPLAIGFYGGEPLLNMPFIEDITTYTKQVETAHNRFIFHITTNGLLLEKYMDFLVQHDFNLLISLDGDEYANSYRVYHDGSPAFAQIIKNIDALKAKFPDYFASRVNFNTVFHNRNNVKDIHRFFKDRFDKIPNISELNPGGVNPEMKKEFWNTYANVAADISQIEDYAVIEKDMFHQLPDTRQINAFLDQCSGFSFNDYNELLANGNPGKNKQLPTGTCIPFSRKVFITVQGKILPCEHIGHQFALGSIAGTEVQLDFQEIADTHNRYLKKIIRQCRSCANWGTCVQCLYYIDFQKDHPVCAGQCNKKSLSREYSAYMSYLEKHPQKYAKIMKEVRIE
jgi:uncharacterized protein